MWDKNRNWVWLIFKRISFLGTLGYKSVHTSLYLSLKGKEHVADIKRTCENFSHVLFMVGVIMTDG